MKKLFIFLLMFITIPTMTVLAIPETIYYEVDILEGKSYDLDTGVLKNDPAGVVTNRFRVYSTEVGILSNDFHHILYWDQHNNYIGYSNTINSGLEGDKYIPAIINETLTFPENTKFFAFMNNLGSTVEYPQFNNMTLDEVFNEYSNYKVSNLLTDGGFSNNNNYTIINNATLEDGVITFGSSGVVRVLNPFTIIKDKYYSVIFSAKQVTTGPINLSFQNIPFSSFYGFLYNLTAQTYFQIYDFTSKAGYNFTVNAVASGGNTVVDYIFIYDRDYVLSILPDYTDLSLRSAIKNSINTNGYKDTIYLAPFYNNKTINMSNLEYESWYEVYCNMRDNYPTPLGVSDLEAIQPIYVIDRNVEPTTPIEFQINDWLLTIGIDNAFGRVLLAIAIMLTVIISLAFIKAPKMIYLGAGVVLYMVFTFIGWFPIWVLILIGILIIILIALSFRGGSSND